MNWYKKSQTIYRGDPNQINIKDYDPNYGIQELGKQLGSSAAEGPGIYFTTKENEAKNYGQHITKNNINNANILTKNNKPFTYQQINKILKKVDQEKLTMAIENWNENYDIGKDLLIKAIQNNNNPIDQLMGIWADVFYHQNPNDFMKLMTNNGIDGISIPKIDSTHYIIYNRNILS